MTHTSNPHFFSDFRSDILWRGADGSVAIWDMNGTTLTSGTLVTSPGGAVVNPGDFWTIAGTGNFDFDDRSDILWRGADGSVAIWNMNDATLASSALVTFPDGTVVNPGAFWTIAGTSHFDFNSSSEILWRGADGSVAIWDVNWNPLVNSATLASSALVTSPGGAVVNPGDFWTIADTGDFDQDSRSNDILWRGADGSVAIWGVNWSQSLNSATLASSALVTSPGGAVVNPGDFWTIAGTGDFDNDNRADILWRGADGSVAIWNMNGTTLTSGALVTSPNGAVVNPGDFWTIAGTGDFFGDNGSDILWRGADGSVAIWNMNGTTLTSGALVTSPGGAVVNPGDFWTIMDNGADWVFFIP